MIDAYAHVLLPEFYKKMLEIKPDLKEVMPFINNEVLTDIEKRRELLPKGVLQIISHVNVNPEDYVDGDEAYKLCFSANEELIGVINKNPDIFYGGVAMVPMNNIDGAVKIMEEQVKNSDKLFGIQLFTRALGKSIAADEYRKVFEVAYKNNLTIWIHPIFDERKPDNNLVFSWEYELSQAMMEIVKAGIFKDFPNIKIIIHHAGAMVPFFAGRIKYILGDDYLNDFKKFYVDTAILGNPKALELALDFYGLDHILFGTDAPFGILPAGGTKEIKEAIEKMNINKDERDSIFYKNIVNMINETK